MLRNAAELLTWCHCLANTATSTSKVQAVQAPKKCRNPVPVATWWLHESASCGLSGVLSLENWGFVRLITNQA
jgi:hypothetical protein